MCLLLGGGQLMQSRKGREKGGLRRHPVSPCRHAPTRAVQGCHDVPGRAPALAARGARGAEQARSGTWSDVNAGVVLALALEAPEHRGTRASLRHKFRQVSM